MQFIKRRLNLVSGVVLAMAVALLAFFAYQNYAREKQNQETIGNYKIRKAQQRSFNEVMRAHRERALIKKPKSTVQPSKSPETP